MVQMREAIGFAAFVVGAAVITAVNHHPNHGRRTERERVAVAAAATAFTHQQIATAWTQMKLANPEPLLAIEQAFPLRGGQSTKTAGASCSRFWVTTTPASTS